MGEERGDDAALRRTTGCGVVSPVLHIARFQQRCHEGDEARISNLLGQGLHQPPMIDVRKATGALDSDPPLDSLPGAPDLRARGMAGAAWAPSMRVTGAHRLLEAFQKQTCDCLHERVVASRNAQRACLPMRCGDLDPSGGCAVVPALCAQPREVGDSCSGDAGHRDGSSPTGHGPLLGRERGRGLQPQVRALQAPQQAVQLLPVAGDLRKRVQPLRHGCGSHQHTRVVESWAAMGAVALPLRLWGVRGAWPIALIPMSIRHPRAPAAVPMTGPQGQTATLWPYR
jgi:hypothetical protein